MKTQELRKQNQADVVRRKETSATPARPVFRPATDVRETAEALVLTFDMPGVDQEHVAVTLERDTLLVTGTTGPEESGVPVYCETRVGDYRREFSLDECLDTDRIQADMKAGVLTVRIPKPEKAQPRRVPVQTV